MDDISKELGMSKKTIYQFVANKTELVEKVLSYMHEKEKIPCTDEDTLNMNAIDILLAVSKNVSIQLQDMNPINAYELQKYYPTIYREFIIKKRVDDTQLRELEARLFISKNWWMFMIRNFCRR